MKKLLLSLAILMLIIPISFAGCSKSKVETVMVTFQNNTPNDTNRIELFAIETNPSGNIIKKEQDDTIITIKKGFEINFAIKNSNITDAITLAQIYEVKNGLTILEGTKGSIGDGLTAMIAFTVPNINDNITITIQMIA